VNTRRPVIVLLTAIVIVLATAGCEGSASSSVQSNAPPANSTTTSKAPAATTARKASPKRKPKPIAAGGLEYSNASNDVVQPQPAPGSCHARGSGPFSVPDPKCTPGALNPAVTQRTIDQTICVSGWTRTVRPPESITEQEKTASMAAYGDSGPTSAYEYDHLVPLELGGATNDARNLWPEPGGSPNPKDPVENALHGRVCDGQMSLVQAQHIVATAWVSWAHSNGASATTTAQGASTTSTVAPAPTTSSTSSLPVVHPGAFCSPAGAQGVTTRGTPMTCKTSATDSRARWRHSG
jgi:hypothetical protein